MPLVDIDSKSEGDCDSDDQIVAYTLCPSTPKPKSADLTVGESDSPTESDSQTDTDGEAVLSYTVTPTRALSATKRNIQRRARYARRTEGSPTRAVGRGVTSNHPKNFNRRVSDVHLVELYRHKGGIKFWARRGVDEWVVGGPGSSRQDSVSLNLSPTDAAGRTVKIDRFQINKQFRRQGVGTLVLREVVKTYRGSGASKLTVPVTTSQGSKLYRQQGFVRGVELHELDLQSSEYTLITTVMFSVQDSCIPPLTLCPHIHPSR